MPAGQSYREAVKHKADVRIIAVCKILHFSLYSVQELLVWICKCISTH